MCRTRGAAPFGAITVAPGCRTPAYARGISHVELLQCANRITSTPTGFPNMPKAAEEEQLHKPRVAKQLAQYRDAIVGQLPRRSDNSKVFARRRTSSVLVRDVNPGDLVRECADQRRVVIPGNCRSAITRATLLRCQRSPRSVVRLSAFSAAAIVVSEAPP